MSVKTIEVKLNIVATIPEDHYEGWVGDIDELKEALPDLIGEGKIDGTTLHSLKIKLKEKRDYRVLEYISGVNPKDNGVIENIHVKVWIHEDDPLFIGDIIAPKVNTQYKAVIKDKYQFAKDFGIHRPQLNGYIYVIELIDATGIPRDHISKGAIWVKIR